MSEDKTLPPSHNLAQIARIAKGFAPMLTEVLEDYIAQNTGSGVTAIKTDEAGAEGIYFAAQFRVRCGSATAG